MPLLSYGRRSPALRPCYGARYALHFARANALHKDIDSIIFTEETIRTRIAAMGRCAAPFVSRTGHHIMTAMYYYRTGVDVQDYSRRL